MKPPPVAYERAESLEHALSMLDAHPDVAKVLAGGQSLIPLLNLRLARPEILVDIADVVDLAHRRTDGELRVGALTTLAELGSDPELSRLQPLLAEAVPHVAHIAIRNRGTVGGTIAHADPAAELPVVLAALGGRVVARSSAGEREIEAPDFFRGFLMTALLPNEVIESVVFPTATEGRSYAFEEFARRPGDFALASVACSVRREGESLADARIAVGGVSMTPLVLEGVREAAAGAGAADAEAAARAVGELARSQVEPRGDIHGSAEYRTHLVGALVRRALRRALTSD